MCFQLGRWESTEYKDKRKLLKLSKVCVCLRVYVCVCIVYRYMNVVAAKRMYRFSIRNVLHGGELYNTFIALARLQYDTRSAVWIVYTFINIC